MCFPLLVSIQYQIAKEYGSGSHWLVPNSKTGKVGKRKKYCNLEEAKDLELNDLEMSQIWETELSIFIKDWVHPKFTRRLKRAEEKYEKEQDQELDKFFESDLFDSDAVGDDITNKEFLQNEMDFEMR